MSLQANVSSQYISALLLIATKLENGLELTLEGEITSVPYINMTLSLLDEIGVESSFDEISLQSNQHPIPNLTKTLMLNPIGLQHLIIIVLWHCLMLEQK